MNLPERFDLNYIDQDGQKKRPLMLHRVVFGSIERFIGIIIEHFGGAFPLWLAPRQVVIVPVHHEEHLAYAEKVKDELEKVGLRVEIDDRNEKLGYRIREAQTQKVPYALVLGDNERENELVTIRHFGKKDTETISLVECVSRLKEERDNKVYEK